jgi:hypothetical protein
MKVAILAAREDAHRLLPLLRSLRRIGLSAYALTFTPAWIELERARVHSLLHEAGHFLIIANAMSVTTSWFGFAVGASLGRHEGLSLFRHDPAWELPAYLRGVPVLEGIEELEAFFSAKIGLWEVEEGRQKARTALLELGISLHADSLASCVREGDIHAIDLFLDAGFNPDSRDKHGVPLLCLAARSHHQGVAQLLLERGADIDLQSEDRGYTALMDAVKGGTAEQASFFLERGADPNRVSKDGQNALIIAVGRKDPELVRLLLGSGADPDRKDKLGMSARAYARLFKLPLGD